MYRYYVAIVICYLHSIVVHV